MNRTLTKRSTIHSSAQFLKDRVNYIECLPHRSLANYLFDFWQISPIDPADHVPSQLFPTDMARIWFMIFKDRIQALVYGPSTSAQRRGLYVGDQVSFGATLLPTATRHLFGCDADELRDLRVNLDVFWSGVEELCDRLAHASFTGRVQQLACFLGKKLRGVRAVHPDFLNAYAQLSASAGQVPIGHLCRSSGISQRTLNRHFRSLLGVSAKECARILRLHQHLSGRVPFIDIVDGFADQSHWIREFKAMVGLPPKRYFYQLASLHQLEHSFWDGTDVAHYSTTPPAIVRFPDWRPEGRETFSRPG